MALNIDIGKHLVEHEILRQNTWIGNGANTYYLKGNVGIGTASPILALHVKDGSVGVFSDSADSFYYIGDSTSGGTYGYMTWDFTNDKLQLGHSTGGVKMTLEEGGNVGIGTTSPFSKFHVLESGTALTTAGGDQASDVTIEGPARAFGGSFVSNLAVISNDAQAADKGGGIVLGGKYSGNAFAYWAGMLGAKDNSNSGEYGGYLSFATRTHGANIAERMRIDSAGNVGIGTTSPSRTLDIHATVPTMDLNSISAGSGDGPIFRMIKGNTAQTVSTQIYDGGQIKWNILNSAGDDLTWYGNNGVTGHFTIQQAGNVGIGLTGPEHLLDVRTASGTRNGVSLSTELSYRFLNLMTGGGDVNYITWDDGDDLGFGVADTRTDRLPDTTHMTIKAGGNVGIGTASPDYAKLVVNQSSASSGNDAEVAIGGLYDDPTGGTNYGNLYIFSTNATAADAGGVISLGGVYTDTGMVDTRYAVIHAGKATAGDNNYGGYLRFFTRTHGATPAERLRIDSAGNVGIGLTGPEHLLDVRTASGTRNGVSLSTELSYRFLNLMTGGGDVNYITWDDGDDLGFGVADTRTDRLPDTTHMTIKAGGNVGIGTASPGQKLDLESTGNNVGIELTATDATDQSYYIFSASSGNSNGQGLHIQDLTTGGSPIRMTILSGGNVGIGTTSPGDNLEIAEAGTNSQTVQLITTYNDQVGYRPEFVIRKSHSDTLGTLTDTIDTEELGMVRFRGVDSGQAWDDGAIIKAVQDGAAGAKLPTNLIFSTFSSTAENANQLVLHNDGNVGIGTATPSETLEVAGGVKITLGIREPNYYHDNGSPTDDDIFDAMKASIPNNGDEMMISGGAMQGDANKFILSRAVREDSTHIRLYGFNVVGADTEEFTYLEVTDGGGILKNGISIAW